MFIVCNVAHILLIGALIHRWISLVRANGNAVQRTVRSGRTIDLLQRSLLIENDLLL